MRRVLTALVVVAVTAGVAALPALPARATEVVVTSGVSTWPFGLDRAGGHERRTHAAATADVTGDGAADVVHLLGDTVQFFQVATTTADENGELVTTATAVTDLTTQHKYVSDLALGDVDEDGDLDAVVTFVDAYGFQAEHSHQVFRGDGAGGWTADPMVPSGAYQPGTYGNAELVDFDGDGHLDLLRSGAGVTVQDGDGSGAFGTARELLAVTAGAFDVGDLDGDGRPDLVLGAWGGHPSTFVVALNDGAGAVAGTTTYEAGTSPDTTIADVDGDGWADIVVGVVTSVPGRLLAFANNGDGTFAATGTELAPYRVFDLTAVDVDGDGMLDLAGSTTSGPVLLRRTGPNEFDSRHVQGDGGSVVVAVADLTGDGRAEVVGWDNGPGTKFWRGSPDAALHVEIDPAQPLVHAWDQVPFTATVRNSPVPVQLRWSATRGAFPEDTYIEPGTYYAPSSASPAGSTVRIDVSLVGTDRVASREITVVRDGYAPVALGGTEVRDVVADPALPGVVYAATSDGVYRSTSGLPGFERLGVPPAWDADRLAVVRDGAGTARLLAVFGTELYRYDLAGGGGWLPAGSATEVSAVPGSAVVWAAGGGQVLRSADGGVTWTALGGDGVTDVEAVDEGTVWVTSGAAPFVAVGTYADGALTLAPHALPSSVERVTALAVDPAARTTAYVGSDERLFRGSTSSDAWQPLPSGRPTSTRVSAGPQGDLLAASAEWGGVLRSHDGGASWYRSYLGIWSHFVVVTVAHVGGVAVLGTTDGLYVTAQPEVPATPVLTGGPSGVTGTGAAEPFMLTWDSAAPTICALDGGAWEPCTSPKTYEGPLPTGPHTFSVVAVSDGYDSPPAARTWTVDATAPAAPVLTGGPAGTVASATAAFAFTVGEDATGALCALDSARPAPCTSVKTYADLGDLTHTFTVWAVNGLGNRSAPVTRTWTVDTRAPSSPNLSGKPGQYTASTAVSFGWFVQDDATYACTFDGAGVACPSGTYAAEGLAHGPHAFTVVATDGVGNSSSTLLEWFVDLTAPEPPALEEKPASPTRSSYAGFVFARPLVAGMPNAGYRCSLDGAAPAPCTRTVTYWSLALGTHTLAVYALDAAGRAGGTTTYEWVVTDEPAPALPVLTAGPMGSAGSRTATFTYTLPAGTTARCTLDGAQETACPATGITYENLTEGPHHFAVRTVAPSGLASEPAIRGWTVDVTPPPAPVLTAKPAARTAEAAAAFGWSSFAGSTYRCALDGAESACDTSMSFARQVGGGTHEFAVTVKDGAGNVSAPATYTWTVDLTAPVVTIDAKPPALTGTGDAHLAFSSTAPDLDHWTCSVDGTERDCDGALDLSSLADGDHVFSVTGHDDVGNASKPVVYHWTVDTTAPAVTFGAGGTSLTAGRAVTFGEPVTGVTAQTVRLLLGVVSVPASVSYDAASRRAVVTPLAPLVPGGTYTVVVNGVIDAAGHTAVAASQPFRVSTSEQETSVAARAAWRRTVWSGAQGGSYTVAHLKGESATYEFSGTGITWYAVRGPSYGLADVYVDGVKKPTVSFWSASVGATYKNVTGLANGTHTLRVVVRGEKGAASGTGTDVAVDAFRAGGVTAATPAVTYGWARTLTSAASGGTYAVEDYAGATYAFTFRGTGVDWVTVAGPSMGKATIHVDGVLKGTVDNYASALRYGVVRHVGGLADGTHTVTVTVLRQRRPGATGYGVAVDRFGVVP